MGLDWPNLKEMERGCCVRVVLPVTCDCVTMGRCFLVARRACHSERSEESYSGGKFCAKVNLWILY